jgi:hypothetical protein
MSIFMSMNLPQLVIILFAIVGLGAAIIAFIKTPKFERYKFNLTPAKQEGIEYAPEYTTKERINIILKTLVWAGPLVAAFKFWFFPWFKQYSANAHCYQYGSFTGLHIIFYGIFIGLPLLTACMILIIGGKRSINIIKLGQFPLPSEKVLKPTKYIYGTQAKLKAYLFFALLLFALGLSVQGYFWAQPLISKISSADLSKCSSLQSP